MVRTFSKSTEFFLPLRKSPLCFVSRIAQSANFIEHDVSKYASQILRALQYMHERQIYHGKIHGQNVLIRTVENDERVCLVDYAYANLCTRDAITLLVNGSPSFCGTRK